MTLSAAAVTGGAMILSSGIKGFIYMGILSRPQVYRLFKGSEADMKTCGIIFCNFIVAYATGI
jgi:hypothetical protein